MVDIRSDYNCGHSPLASPHNSNIHDASDISVDLFLLPTVIDNADGSRYADGVKQPDPTPVTDDNHVGSGSTHDGDTTNPTIIRIHTSGAPYYEDITPDALSTDYSSVSGRKEYHSTSTSKNNGLYTIVA